MLAFRVRTSEAISTNFVCSIAERIPEDSTVRRGSRAPFVSCFLQSGIDKPANQLRHLQPALVGQLFELRVLLRRKENGCSFHKIYVYRNDIPVNRQVPTASSQ